MSENFYGNKECADELYLNGLSLQKEGKYEKALEEYMKVLKICIGHKDAWFNAGKAFLKIGKKEKNVAYLEQSVRAFDRTLEIDALNISAWFDKGVALNELKKYKEAIECFDKFLGFDPRNINAWFNKGVVLGKLEKYMEANRCYDKALEFDPENTPAWINKVFALEKLGKGVEANRCYDRALEIDPKFTRSWFNE